jgi:high affinity choline transporter 7
MGVAAFAYPWSAEHVARLRATPADAMPLLFAIAVPPAVGLLGLAAIIGAVTSSFSSSILSAGSMFSWNVVSAISGRRSPGTSVLSTAAAGTEVPGDLRPAVTVARMARVIRASILLFGAVATVLALRVQSVQALWFFTSDLVFVLLFPQLLYALYDPKANRAGSIAAFAVSLILRVGAGEPLLGVPALFAYPAAFPFRTVAAAAGLVLLPIVSRATAAWDAARPLRNSFADAA